MTDIFSKEKRSEIMGKVRGINTKPELLVRRYLFKRGFRYRIHQKLLAGTPDLVLRKYKTVIFIHGCFWHGHQDCKSASIPKTHTEFWNDKIEQNKKRDRNTYDILSNNGWNVVIIYECDLKSKKLEDTMSNIINMLTTVNNIT